MVKVFIESLFLIFMAEMGDKTQILAMAFATRFKIKEVLLGVFIGSFLNHGIAVLLGGYLSNLIPMRFIQMAAGFLFVCFGLLTLEIENEEEEEKKRKKLGPILTVATAFFIGELGDKTQLTAITLAMDTDFLLFVLMGTVLGMVLTSGLGIFIGSKIGDKIPEFAIKIISAVVFIFFGVAKLYNTIPKHYITISNIAVFMILIGSSIYIIIRRNVKIIKEGEVSAFKETAMTLYEYTNRIEESVNHLCLGEKHCLKCQGKGCIIGHIKFILNQVVQNNKNLQMGNINDFSKSLNKNFSKVDAIESLSLTIAYLINDEKKDKNQNLMIRKVRQSLELLLFKHSLVYDENIERYFTYLKKADQEIGGKVIKRVEELIKE